MYPSSPDIRKLHDNGEGICFICTSLIVCLALLLGSVFTLTLTNRQFRSKVDPVGDFLLGGPGSILNAKAVKVACIFLMCIFVLCLDSGCQIIR